MKYKMRNITFAILAILFLSFPFFSYSKPVVDMEVVYENAAHAINTIGLVNLTNQYYWDQVTYAHPPVYILSLSLFCKMFGLNLVSMRLLGFAAVLLMALLVYFLSQEIFKEKKDRLWLGLLCSLLYLSIPLIIQGSVLLDIDNTLLPISMIIFVMAYIHFCRQMNAKKIILLGCLFALALWSKITTSLVLIIAIGVFHLLERNFRQALKRPLVIFLIGASIFLATFSLYCCLVNWKCFRVVPMVFSVAWIKQPAGTFYFKIFTMLKTILRLSLWMSPYLILLWLISLKESFERIYKGLSMNPLNFLSIYSCLILLGYLYFGGSHVFPRYHIPMIFAICILVTNSIQEIFKGLRTKESIFYIAAILFMTGYYVFVVKDMLYFTNYELKVALTLDIPPNKELLFTIVKQVVFYVLPLPAVFLLVKSMRKEWAASRAILSALFILTVSSNVGLNILQAKSDYACTEHYGTNGQREVVSFLKNHIDLNKGDEIITHCDINYYLGKRDFPIDPFIELELKYDPLKLLMALKDKKIKALVCNVPQFTLRQIKEVIRDKNVQKLLEKEFIEFRFQSYRVWLKK